MTSKNCTLCGELKPLSKFYKRKDRKCGRASACNNCALELSRARMLKNKDRRLYGVWVSMRSRCNNKNNPMYKNYGGRGIIVCSELDDSNKFISWAKENGYKVGLQIDRENNNSSYYPVNCRFVTSKINNNNKRKQKSSQKYIGVTPHRKKWRSTIRINSESIYIGHFPNKIDAAVARDSYVINNCPERRLNFPRNITEII